MKPMKRCNHIACKKLIPFDEPYCDNHKRETVKERQWSRREVNRSYDDKRKQEEPKIYAFYQSKRWERLSRQIKIRDDFMCQECLRNDKYTVADVTDHIIEIRDDWENRWNTKTMEALCHNCHNRKSRKSKTTRNTKP